MKTSLLTLLLTAVGLWAQTPASPPVFRAFPTNAVVNTNREQALQRALQRAMERRTNTAVPGVAGTPAKPVAGGDPSAAAPAGRNQPRTLPTATPGSNAISNAPAGVVRQ